MKDLKENSDFKGWMVYVIVSILFMISLPFWTLLPPWLAYLGTGVFVLIFAIIWTALSRFGSAKEKRSNKHKE